VRKKLEGSDELKGFEFTECGNSWRKMKWGREIIPDGVFR